MSTLERRCLLLLRAYPAAYRKVRGEEIVGTLLEATPPGRSWPRQRDIRGLIFGGLRARAALNQQLSTAANLRVAVLVGVAAYLAYNALAVLSLEYFAEVSGAGHIHPVPRGWPFVLASALTLVPVALAFLTSRRAVVLAAALPAAAVIWYAGPWYGVFSAAAVHLALLAALVALVTLARKSRRPRRRWLAGVGILAALPIVPDFAPQLRVVDWLLYGVLLAPAAISIVWAVIDARPAISIVVFFLAGWLPVAVNNLAQGFGAAIAVPFLVIATVVAVPALWLLRRQSAHPGRPTQA